MIELNNIEKSYPHFHLGPINFQINRGEFISIIGPSGTGKSTLIKLISNLIKADKGEISYKIKEEEILYISQKGTTFNHLTVKENLRIKDFYEEGQMIKALEKVSLSKSDLEKYPFQLSGGERQRIDLARALLTNAKLLILDESMSALDKKNKESISELVLALVNSNKISVLYITHDEYQARKYSHQLVNLSQGKILEIEDLRKSDAGSF
ncbi:MAG: ATP-binding cassette domain-containing protein [Lactovum sp.]